jgi:hypothetical protein
VVAVRRATAKQYHPDVIGDVPPSGDDSNFVAINAAYLTLSNPILRSEYDSKKVDVVSRLRRRNEVRGRGSHCVAHCSRRRGVAAAHCSVGALTAPGQRRISSRRRGISEEHSGCSGGRCELRGVCSECCSVASSHRRVLLRLLRLLRLRRCDADATLRKSMLRAHERFRKGAAYRGSVNRCVAGDRVRAPHTSGAGTAVALRWHDDDDGCTIAVSPLQRESRAHRRAIDVGNVPFDAYSSGCGRLVGRELRRLFANVECAHERTNGQHGTFKEQPAGGAPKSGPCTRPR